MDPRDEVESDQLEMLAQAFREQLLACVEECALGRKGLFSGYERLGGEGDEDVAPARRAHGPTGREAS